MKRVLIVLFLSIISLCVNSQDFIYKKGGEKIEAKILKFGTSEITYKIWEYQKAPSQTISTSAVRYVQYQNGDLKNEDGTSIKTKDTFTDKRDGITYKTIFLDGQTWMAENLRATKTTQGVDITWVVPDEDWTKLSDTDLAYCYYNNDPELGETYGVLYNWHTAQNVCPSGWHLPSNAEWDALETFFGTNAGSKLAGNATLWNDGDLDQSADFGISGFFALPSGNRINNDGSFNGLGVYGCWWCTETCSSSSSSYVDGRHLYYSNATVLSIGYYKSIGFSVRCVRD